MQKHIILILAAFSVATFPLATFPFLTPLVLAPLVLTPLAWGETAKSSPTDLGGTPSDTEKEEEPVAEIPKALTIPVHFYGFLLPTYTFAESGVNSFSSNNLVAPTSAASSGVNSNRLSAGSFQFSQSRFGFRASPSDRVTGTLEFDLVNFNAGAPSTQVNPRIRLAKIRYLASPSVELELGQDWNIINGNVHPFTYNPIGNYFQAGNMGFIHPQAIAKIKLGEDELAFALGAPGFNATSSVSNTELSMIPTLATRYLYRMGPSFVGVAGEVGRVIFNQSINNARMLYTSAFLFETRLSTFQIRGKLYWGQNLSNAPNLSLNVGRAENDFREYGGFVSARNEFGSVGLFGGVGYATSVNPDGVAAQSMPVGGPMTSTGLVSNGKVALGIDYSPISQIQFFTETSYYFSQIKLDQNALPFQSIVVDSGLKMIL